MASHGLGAHNVLRKTVFSVVGNTQHSEIKVISVSTWKASEEESCLSLWQKYIIGRIARSLRVPGLSLLYSVVSVLVYVALV